MPRRPPPHPPTPFFVLLPFFLSSFSHNFYYNFFPLDHYNTWNTGMPSSTSVDPPATLPSPSTPCHPRSTTDARVVCGRCNEPAPHPDSDERGNGTECVASEKGGKVYDTRCPSRNALRTDGGTKSSFNSIDIVKISMTVIWLVEFSKPFQFQDRLFHGGYSEVDSITGNCGAERASL